jgi:hypothetical protein
MNESVPQLGIGGKCPLFHRHQGQYPAEMERVNSRRKSIGRGKKLTMSGKSAYLLPLIGIKGKMSLWVYSSSKSRCAYKWESKGK